MPYAPPPSPPPAIATAPASSLDQLRGRSRVVLVFAPSATDDRLRYQLSEVRRLTAGRDKRDLQLVVVAGGDVQGATDASAALRSRFHIVMGGYRTFLIGKDGHVALRSSAPIPSEEIAREIDAMPMRQEEVKAKR